MRTVLAVDLTVAALLFGPYIGVVSHGYSTGQRITLAGFFAFVVAFLAAQYKAAEFGLPFDNYSWGLLGAVTLINCGLGWSLWERRPRKRE